MVWCLTEEFQRGVVFDRRVFSVVWRLTEEFQRGMVFDRRVSALYGV